jgi:hypothetical protein
MGTTPVMSLSVFSLVFLFAWLAIIVSQKKKSAGKQP